jgi:branched-chain amino acid transport system ATP-binding protein
LMTDPKVLLLDEPGAGLGHSERGMLADAVRKMASKHGLGIAIIDHDMPLVLSTCQKICVLVNGRVAAYGTPTEILAHPEVRSAYLGQTTPTV